MGKIGDDFGPGEDIDPKRLEAGDKPKRRRKARLRKREPMPAKMRPDAAKAKRRVQAMPCQPGIMIEPTEDGSGFTFVSPHDDDQAWGEMLCSAFGTRSYAVRLVFMRHLKDLCRQTYNDDLEAWKPSEQELNAAVSIVNSTKPRNELDAMHVAQMVAIHWLQMRVVSYEFGSRSGWIDPRTAATASMLSRTFTLQMAELRKNRGGKRPKIKQEITVIHRTEVHHYDHSQHIHLEGGSPDFGGQPQEARELRHVQKRAAGAGEPSERPALPRPESSEGALRLPGDEGKEGVSSSRGQGRRSKGSG